MYIYIYIRSRHRRFNPMRPARVLLVFFLWLGSGGVPMPVKRRASRYAALADDSDSDSNMPAGDPVRRQAGADMLKHMLTMYAQSRMSAKDLCVLAHLQALAATPGANWSLYAVPPGQGSGNYQRHLDTVMPGPEALYMVPTVCVTRSTTARATRNVATIAVHETIAAEINEEPAIKQRAAAMVWPPCYHEHPLVIAAASAGRPPPIPLALYCDGVRYTAPLAGRTGSIVGFWAVNLVTQKRHLLAAVRSADACRCGCHGWCSTAPILHALAWGFRALAEGVRPDTRHDDLPWEPEDPLVLLRNEHGPALGFQGVLIWCKGDWGEVGHTLGLRQVTTKWAPCPFCRSTQACLHTGYRSASIHELPWPARTSGEYEATCGACETTVMVETREARDKILAKLAYKKGDQGRGRTLVADVEVISKSGSRRTVLRARSRLEPSASLLDVGDFDNMEPPFKATFWLSQFTQHGQIVDMALHRNPLFAESLARSPTLCLSVDTLHTLYLGVVQRLVSAIVWRVMHANPWGFRGPKKVQLELACRQLRAHLMRWFAAEALPASLRLGDLTLPMLGSAEEGPAGCSMRLKAVETTTLLPWSLALLGTFGEAIQYADELRVAGEALVEYLTIIRTQPLVIPPADQQRLFESCQRHLIMAERAGVHFVPKHHMWLHMTYRSPSRYSR